MKDENKITSCGSVEGTGWGAELGEVPYLNETFYLVEGYNLLDIAQYRSRQLVFFMTMLRCRSININEKVKLRYTIQIRMTLDIEPRNYIPLLYICLQTDMQHYARRIPCANIITWLSTLTCTIHLMTDYWYLIDDNDFQLIQWLINTLTIHGCIFCLCTGYSIRENDDTVPWWFPFPNQAGVVVVLIYCLG